MASDMGTPGLANMVLLGTVIRETGCVKPETVDEALRHVIPARKANLFDFNMKAVQAGREYGV